MKINLDDFKTVSPVKTRPQRQAATAVSVSTETVDRLSTALLYSEGNLVQPSLQVDDSVPIPHPFGKDSELLPTVTAIPYSEENLVQPTCLVQPPVLMAGQEPEADHRAIRYETPDHRRGVRLTPDERATIRQLHATGASVSSIARQLDRHRETVATYLTRRAQDVLQGNAEAYAHLHHAAAKVAAEKGDARPAEWAMERLEVVKPKQTAAGSSGPGWSVRVGVMLPGLGALAIEAGSNEKDPAIIDEE